MVWNDEAGIDGAGNGYSLCHGAFTIINGISIGMGGACGVELRILSRFQLTSEPGNLEFEAYPAWGDAIDDRLARSCSGKLLTMAGLLDSRGARLETVSEIPPSRGLKSSSAAANAILMAGIQALGVEREPLDVVRLGVDCALQADVSITGAFDDAVATMFGGAVLTDNERKRIISWVDLDPSLRVLFLVPNRRIEKSSLRRKDFLQARDLVIKAFEMARNGHIAEAITLNGRAYAPLLGVDTGPVDAAIAAGAWAAGMTGTGPAIAVLVDPKVEEEVLAALTPYKGLVIRTGLNSSPARLLTEEEYDRCKEEILGGEGGVR